MTSRRRAAGMVLLDRDSTGLVNAIEEAVERVEPLASYLPTPVLTLLVESTARRRITPDFPRPTVIFVNLVGLPESVDRASPEEVDGLVRAFSQAFALINAAAPLMGRAGTNQILLSDVVYQGIAERFECVALGTMPLKGKTTPVPLFTLHQPRDSDVSA